VGREVLEGSCLARTSRKSLSVWFSGFISRVVNHAPLKITLQARHDRTAALCRLAAMPWKGPDIGSRVTREGHARFWERPEAKLLRATRQNEPLAQSRGLLTSVLGREISLKFDLDVLQRHKEGGYGYRKRVSPISVRIPAKTWATEDASDTSQA
jgi:uncharacterized protein (DUF4415 family)